MRKLFLTLGLSTLVVACSGGKQIITIVSLDGTSEVSVNVELAITPEEQQQGLMGRTHLSDDTGMLFVFDQDQPLSFWMKNTLIPLQILYFAGDGTFVNVLDMEPCEEDPCEQYRSAALAMYALEVNPGFREKHGVGVGWKLDNATLEALSR